MTTTLNVSLSQTLQTELGQQGVWAYAVYYDINGDNPQWTNLVTDGTIEGSGTVARGDRTVHSRVPAVGLVAVCAES